MTKERVTSTGRLLAAASSRYVPSLIAAMSLPLSLTACGDGDPQATVAAKSAVDACEEATMDQMRTPSSFKTLWSDYTEREPLSREDRQEMYKAGRCAPIGEKECVLEADRFADAYIDNEVKAVRALIKAGRKLNADQTKTAQAFGMVEMPKDDSPAAKTGFVLLEYESENGFGANVRGFGICRFHAIGSDGKFEKADIVRAGPIPLEEGIAAKAQYEELNRIGKTASKG